MTDALPKLSVFDVDGTLIKGDSFFPYLMILCGRIRTFIALYQAAFSFFWNSPRHKSNDARTYIKAELMSRLLKGIKTSDAADAAEKLRIWRVWNEPMRETLLEHYNKGHHIVIASGGLNIYLPEILKDIPYHTLICTNVGQENGLLTGIMTEGNCVRLGKSERVAAYIRDHGPYGESWGFGNYPHDVPMLELVRHRVLV